MINKNSNLFEILEQIKQSEIRNLEQLESLTADLMDCEAIETLRANEMENIEIIDRLSKEQASQNDSETTINDVSF